MMKGVIQLANARGKVFEEGQGDRSCFYSRVMVSSRFSITRATACQA